ncbi:MAG: arylsulfatase, partial [Opitutales bacterium]
EGQSFSSILNGDKGTYSPHDALFWAHSKGKAIRVGDWKLVSENKRPWELYNLNDDPTELSDLAQKMPEKAKALEKQHTQWVKRTDLSKKQ